LHGCVFVETFLSVNRTLATLLGKEAGKLESLEARRLGGKEARRQGGWKAGRLESLEAFIGY
jgi:hypothetical protein